MGILSRYDVGKDEVVRPAASSVGLRRYDETESGDDGTANSESYDSDSDDDSQSLGLFTELQHFAW